MNAFQQKLAWTGVAFLAALLWAIISEFMPTATGAASALALLTGAIVAWVWGIRPGDMQLPPDQMAVHTAVPRPMPEKEEVMK
jgi:hypothetical protein